MRWHSAIPLVLSVMIVPAVWAGSAEDFAARLESALVEGPIARDRLWAPGARDSTARVRDVRAWSLFRWSDVEVEVESDGSGGSSDTLDVVLVVRGTATWAPNAWGVARVLWTRHTDEHYESNRVVTREHWRLVDTAAGPSAVSRHPLAPFEIVEARINTSIYPGQDAMLVDCSWYVRALADDVRHVRFLLDRRAHIYDLRVDGKLARLVRGNELGGLGLEGWSPECESSFELPDPLREGEQAAIRIQVRAPLVHMSTDELVTTLPLLEGPFRERLWMPVPDPSRPGRAGGSEIELALRCPVETFAGTTVACPPAAALDDGDNAQLEEDSVLVRWNAGRVQDLDLVLTREAGPPPDTLLAGAEATALAPEVLRFERIAPPEAASSWRDRDLVFPPLWGATQVSRDLTSELQDLLPMDDTLLEELFDDSASDAERGADDRSAGG